MLRITEKLESGRIVRLRLDGRVTAVALPELEQTCSRYLAADAKVVLLDLGGVVFMNDEVARKLIELRNARLKLINCSPFIEALIRAVAGQDGE